MCDYSLHAVSSRPAKVGDRLVTSRFPQTLTRGFAAEGEPKVAVCLRPGTEIAFESEAQVETTPLRKLWHLLFGSEQSPTGRKVARFRQVNTEIRATHHDAVEFPGGEVVLLTQLAAGQRASVLQLPIEGTQTAKAREAHASPTEV